MCVCVCVSAPRLLKTIHTKLRLNNWLNKFYYFQFLYMTLAIDTINEHGPSNEVCHELLQKKTKIML